MLSGSSFKYLGLILCWLAAWPGLGWAGSENQPSSPQSGCQKARVLFIFGKKHEAPRDKILIYTEALKLCPDKAEGWYHLAQAEEELFKLKEAAGHYRRAVELEPDLAPAHFSLGRVYLRLDDPEAASQSLLTGLILEPGNRVELARLVRAEAVIQAKGRILKGEHLARRLGTFRRISPRGTPFRLSEPVALMNIFFGFNTAGIKPIAHPQLDELARAGAVLFRKPGRKLIIEAHTDNQGKRKYNLELSKIQASALKRYLVENHGLDPARIEPIGLGADQPVAENRTEEGRAANRRIEIRVRD